MPIVRGQDITISINGFTVACWRSSTLNITVDTIAKSTIGSGNWKEFDGNVISWTATGEGLLYQDESFTIHDVYDLMITLETVFMSFSVTLGSTTIYYAGDAIITNIQEQGNVNDNGSFNISLQGTGELIRDVEAIHGNAPENFTLTDVHPDTPGVGEATLDFSWDEATPVPDGYRIEVHDLTDDEIRYTDVTGVTTASVELINGSSHNYTFRIRSAFFNFTALSEYSPTIITWP